MCGAASARGGIRMSEALKLIDETNTKENELSEQSPKTKEIVLPVLRSFRTHLTNMCLLQIAGSLNEQLVTGNLSESLGTTIVTEYVRAARYCLTSDLYPVTVLMK